MNDARYLYCIVPKLEKMDLGITGIGGSRVYTLAFRDIAAIVHDCPPVPYQGEDAIVGQWILEHNEVVERMWQAAGTVIPMSFDVIIKPDEEHTGDENVILWLETNYHYLKSKLEELRDHVEVGVQILWDTSTILRRLGETKEEAIKMRREMETKSKGLAYFYRERLERFLKQQLELQAECAYRDYYQRIRAHAREIYANKVKDRDGKQMIMNVSLLIPRGDISGLGEELEDIGKDEAIEVRFTGPWPPYSFVSPSIKKANEDTKSH